MASLIQKKAGAVTSLLGLCKQVMEYVLFPPRCLACSQPIETAHTLCDSCWPKIRFISEPMCDSCGRPFEYDKGKGLICGSCFKDPPPFDKARSALVYDEHSRKLITRFKYGDRGDVVPGYALWLQRAGAEMLTQTDYIIPVPLHFRRLIQRKFNQSILLAEALSELSSVPLLRDGLVRQKHTPPQASLSQAARRKNVQGAFSINEEYREMVACKRIVLVDDVMTTGATIHACTKALKKAKVAEVNVLTLAQTVIGE